MKELGQDTQRLPEARDPQRPGILGTCSTANIGLRQLKRGTTKYKKWRTDISFSSTQWCSKESESIKQIFMNKGAVPQGTKNEKIIRRNNWKRTFNPAVKDSNYLGIMTARKDNQKLSLKSKKPWKKRHWRSAVQGCSGMESQQVTFRETALKDENHEKKEKRPAPVQLSQHELGRAKRKITSTSKP